LNYDQKVQNELNIWELKMFKAPGILERTSKSIGTRINHLLPNKVHKLITTTIRTIIHTALFGAEYTPSRAVKSYNTLEAADNEANAIFALYQKIAVAEGAGTGAGGIMLSMVDFPALIAIKMKFLFEIAHAYGYSTKHFSERVFILKVFQLTYASKNNRVQLLQSIKNWNIEKNHWSSDTEYYKHLDWDTFQVEYRDAIDFRKMLQVVPGIGAIAGAWANYTIVEELREFAMNAYRLRRLNEI